MMKRLKTILATVVCQVAMIAPVMAHDNYERGIVLNDKQVAQLLRDRIERDLKHRFDTRRVLPVKANLLTDGLLWSNGVNLAFGTLYDSQSHEIGLSISSVDDIETTGDGFTLLCLRGRNVKREWGGDTRFGVERLGAYTMLVERDSRGVPVSAYHAITEQEYYDNVWTMATHLLFAGCYATTQGRMAVFGLRMAHYAGDSYDTDPGVYAYQVARDFSAIDILYGAGRVSGGDPSSLNYGKMPGGGGAGALMGPMQWRVALTSEGVKVNVVHDEPFVAHLPRVDDGSMLRWMQSPFEGIDGRWAIASVMPLTHQMLKLLPTEVLTLMRGEIYARHGDTFANPDTQRYFDAQPWYKKSDRRIVLTDIERFNYALIKQIEVSR